jgi:hypothetical protein
MNNSESAKRGFRTFILTLSISLIVFSAVYYVLTTYDPNSKSGEEQMGIADELGANGVTGNNNAAGKNSSKGGGSPSVQGIEDKRTVFGEIISKKPQVQAQEVLAGATSAPETTQSSTPIPVTGFTEMTFGLLLSLGLFIGAMVYNLINPRKFALSNFEKKMLDRSK